MKKTDTTLYSSPLSLNYWKAAAKEFTSIRTIVIAALFVALRIAVKSLSIPITDNVFIGVDMFVNSIGSMIYGPLVGLAAGAISDTVGAFLFPKGVYFFPFIVVEMLSSFIFGLFLYRAKLGQIRIILSRFITSFVCNILINPAIMIWYNRVLYGKDYKFLSIPRIIKNAALFPLEAFLLVIWIGAISRITYLSKLTYDKPNELKVTAKGIITIIAGTIISVAAIVLYIYVYLPNK